MGTNLAVIDKELQLRLPTFQQVLPPNVSPQRLMRTVLMSCERTPKLLQCSPQSIMNAATTAAVLGLECDGVTGQGFLVPYGGVATFQVGYKGYNTLAARAGYTINGGVVREQDEFDYLEGTGGFVRHKKMLVDVAKRRIIAAWAVAESIGRPNIVVVLPIEDVLAVKAKSQGAKKPDSPWNDMNGPGFPAMVEKTAKRRLARSMPLSVGLQLAAALDEQGEQGRAAYLTPDGNMRVVGEASVAPGPSGNGTISDRQPDDILTPANGGDDSGYSDEPMTPGIVFPNCKTPREFKVYSEPYLASATADEARAWEANYREFIAWLKTSRHADVQAMIETLMETYDAIVSAPTQEAA